MRKNLNIRCTQHARKSLGLKDKPESFIGKFVKKVFSVPNSNNTEAMWVKVGSVENGVLVGKLDNDPVLMNNLKLGDTVRVEVSEIVEVLT